MLILWLLTVPAWGAADSLRVRPVEWAQPVIGMALDNFYRIDAQVYRSQQPDDEAMRALATLGMRSVLNLREYHKDDDEAAGTDLKLYRVPVDAADIDDAFVIEALSALHQAEKPVLIHCWHGSDRTGVVAAMYRMVFQNWPREQAIDEFVNGGYGYHANFYPTIERYLESVDVEAIRRQVLAREQASASGNSR